MIKKIAIDIGKEKIFHKLFLYINIFSSFHKHRKYSRKYQLCYFILHIVYSSFLSKYWKIYSFNPVIATKNFRKIQNGGTNAEMHFHKEARIPSDMRTSAVSQRGITVVLFTTFVLSSFFQLIYRSFNKFHDITLVTTFPV